MQVQKPLTATLDRLADQMIRTDSASAAAGWKFTTFLTKMSALHFDPKNLWEDNTRGDKTYLAIFSGIAILIMLIACINYMNLATARSVKRAKEVGLTKIIWQQQDRNCKAIFPRIILNDNKFFATCNSTGDTFSASIQSAGA